MSKAKIEGLPQGAIGRVAAKAKVSESLVRKVASGERRNVLIEEFLWIEVRDYRARLRRIERMKQVLKEAGF